jgi:hypothetical protein
MHGVITRYPRIPLYQASGGLSLPEGGNLRVVIMYPNYVHRGQRVGSMTGYSPIYGKVSAHPSMGDTLNLGVSGSMTGYSPIHGKVVHTTSLGQSGRVLDGGGHLVSLPMKVENDRLLTYSWYGMSCMTGYSPIHGTVSAHPQTP